MFDKNLSSLPLPTSTKLKTLTHLGKLSYRPFSIIGLNLIFSTSTSYKMCEISKIWNAKLRDGEKPSTEDAIWVYGKKLEEMTEVLWKTSQ